MKQFKNILIIVFLGSFLFHSPLFAQKMVVGKITSSTDLETLPGATVVELDKNNRVINGVITDFEGNYLIKVTSPSNQLSFSFVGYKTKTENIDGRSVINVTLDPEQFEIEGVQVVGKKPISDGFMNVSERNLTSSIQRLSAKDIADIQATSIDEAMQGRLAGVDIVANSGDPGAGMSIRIRGTTSINSSSEPLIVVNGIPYDTDIDDDFDFATADEEGYAQMLNMAPEDIQEISVLKDAAATAVWGSKAANGVLMITTKRGLQGPPQVQYSYKLTKSVAPQTIPMLNGDEFSMMVLEGYMNLEGRPLPNNSTYRVFRYDKEWDEYHNYSQNTDWVDAVTQDGYAHDHNFALAGGGDKATYRVSVGYLNQDGTTIGTSLDRMTTTLNLDYHVSDKISFITDVSYTRSNNSKHFPEISRDYKNVREVAYNKMPNMSIYLRDTLGNPTESYLSPDNTAQGEWPSTYNPVAMANEGMYDILTDRIIPRFGLRYNILKSIKYNFDVSFDINSEKRKLFLPKEATGEPWNDPWANYARDKNTDVFNIRTFNKLYYQPSLGDNHSLIVLLALETEDKTNYTYNAITTNTPSTNLQDPSVTSRIVGGRSEINSGKSQNRSVGTLLTSNYSLLDRYIFSGSIRRDGSSKFGAGKRFGYFPSVSARWRISGEPFMKSIAFIDDLSVRASYGENGNAPGESYTQYNTYTTFSWNYLGQPTMYSKSMELANKKWETTIQRNFGLNLILFENKIDVDVDFYKKRTEDLFFEDLVIPSNSGFSTINMNAGVMDNQGWEVNVLTRVLDLKSHDLKIDFNFNIARNLNIIREISELYPQEKGQTTRNGQYLARIQIDNPVGSFYGYRYLGVYTDEEATIAKDAQGNDIVDINGEPVPMRFNYPYEDYIFQPGDAMYEDINNDGNINEFDIVYLGDANPLLTGGFGTMVSYKIVSINTSFHYRYKADIVNQVKMNTENMYGFNNQSAAVLQRWRHGGDQADIPRALINGGYNWLGSNRFVEDGSFLRFKHVSIYLSLPDKLVRKAKIKNVKIGFTARNMYTWTNYTGQDPEISYGDDPFQIGYDKSRTPRPKDYTVNIKLNF